MLPQSTARGRAVAAAILPRLPTPRVLVVSAEPVGERMAGPAIRAYELARALSGDTRVTLAAPAPSALGDERFELLQAGLADYDALVAAVRDHDVVVAQLLPPRLLARVWREPARLVVDLYNPTVVEVIEATRGKPAASRARLNRIVGRAAAAHLAAADLTLCASERQRDLWLGVLAGRELLQPDALDHFAVVPFGVRREPPQRADPPVMRGPLVPADARILLWGGGIWDWLDAPTAIRAVARLPDDVHLVFQGVKRPALLERDEHAAGARAMVLAGELGLEERVHFNHDWVPYEQRGAWLLEADLGVSAHPAHLETRFAYRTRIADYLWAGLPVVTSAGDVLGDLVAKRGLGRAVPPGDDAAFADACGELFADPGPARVAVAQAADELRWDRIVQPLLDFCDFGTKRAHNRHRARAIRSATLGQYAPIALETLTTDGPATLTRKLATNARRALKRA
jgi:glycosyltransferase involved in cell wall biosynthesis